MVVSVDQLSCIIVIEHLKVSRDMTLDTKPKYQTDNESRRDHRLKYTTTKIMRPRAEENS